MRAHASALLTLAALEAAGLACSRDRPRDPSAVSAGFPDSHPSLLITNPRVLAAVETDGFSFGDVFGVRDASAPRREDYAEESAAVLTRSPLYTGLVRHLQGDLAGLRAISPRAGVGPDFAHRLFDVRWLSSARVHFELVGIVNRLDFRMLAPPGCGQTRLVYRLAYRPPNRPQTRLPLTVNVAYENRETSCAAVARRWLALEKGGDLRSALARGPLANIDVRQPDHVELNLQSLRQNSSGPGMDDHAEYILRGFAIIDGRLVEEGLRNTPAADLTPDQHESLQQWISSNLGAIETGAAEMPDSLLARRAVSVSPRGLSRLANRPLKRLFPDEGSTFRRLPLSANRLVRSPETLVRRLDEQSCVGCHQSRSIAGFHLPGEDRTEGIFNELTIGISEHLRGVLGWRLRFLVAAADGRRLAEPLPLAEHVEDQGQFGAHCLADRAVCTGEPEWACAPGLACQPSAVEGDPIGYCAPAGARNAGDACERVVLTHALGPDGDLVKPTGHDRCFAEAEERGAADEPRCEPNRNGFAGGMCSALCTKEGQRARGGVCVRIPRHGFELACFRPRAIIERCLAERSNSNLQLMRPCSRTEPCRDDFVCARVPSIPLDQGACVPPYFVFQARVDGPPLDR